MPPVGSFGAEYKGEYAEGRKGAENGCKIGSEAHGLEQLAHSCSLLGAYRVDGSNRKNHSHCCNQHRGEYGLELHVRAHRVECRCTECHG